MVPQPEVLRYPAASLISDRYRNLIDEINFRYRTRKIRFKMKIEQAIYMVQAVSLFSTILISTGHVHMSASLYI